MRQITERDCVYVFDHLLSELFLAFFSAIASSTLDIDFPEGFEQTAQVEQ
jgi:hypothetical protein